MLQGETLWQVVTRFYPNQIPAAHRAGFGAAASQPAFGQASGFGAAASQPAFGQASGFGQPSGELKRSHVPSDSPSHCHHNVLTVTQRLPLTAACCRLWRSSQPAGLWPSQWLWRRRAAGRRLWYIRAAGLAGRRQSVWRRVRVSGGQGLCRQMLAACPVYCPCPADDVLLPSALSLFTTACRWDPHLVATQAAAGRRRLWRLWRRRGHATQAGGRLDVAAPQVMRCTVLLLVMHLLLSMYVSKLCSSGHATGRCAAWLPPRRRRWVPAAQPLSGCRPRAHGSLQPQRAFSRRDPGSFSDGHVTLPPRHVAGRPGLARRCSRFLRNCSNIGILVSSSQPLCATTRACARSERPLSSVCAPPPLARKLHMAVACD